MQGNFAIRLVRETFDGVLRKGLAPSLPAVVPQELLRPESGVFVAAYENPGRKPRGRVGSHVPTKSTLAEEIQSQTIRLVETFPFRRQDLPFLTFELLLTKPPQFLADIEDLSPDAGLLVRTRRGLTGISLPSPREQSPAARLRDACQHTGVNRETDDVRMYAFDIFVFTEDH